MKYKLQLILCFIYPAIFCFGQNSSEESYNVKVTPPSPNAATLGKYGDIPVSYYSGIPSIGIPLYTITSGDLTLPISLSYHAGGISLSEEAGWTGLGWAINAGGVVSRTIQNKDDFTGSYFTTQVPEMTERPTTTTELMNSSGGDWPNNYYNESGGEYDWNGIAQSNFNGYDLESDLFNFNFSGRSGKFVLTRSKQILFDKHEDLLVQFDDETGHCRSFTITDELGVQYIFSDIEFSDQGEQVLATSWYLSQIRSPKGNTIKFHYTTEHVAFLPRFSEISRTGCEDGYSSTYSASSHEVRYLSAIEFKNGRVDFEFEQGREDHANNKGKKLKTIKVFKLGSTSPLKTFDFSYSYFNSNESSHAFKRLRLDKLTERGAHGAALPPYTFQYNDVPSTLRKLTAKNSFSIDHWGYFNGVYNSGLIPPFQGFASWGSRDVINRFVNLPGANRNPNPSFSKIFSIKSIKYPTGGMTVFELESNDFDDSRPFTGPPADNQVEIVNKEKRFTISAKGETTGTIDLSKKFGPNVEMIVAFRCSVNDGCATVRRSFSYGSIYFQSLGHNRDLMGDLVQCSSQSPVCKSTISISILNGNHSWKAYIDKSIQGFQDITVTFKWQETQFVNMQANGNFISPCGGLRVKKITNYDENGLITSSRKFEYTYEEDRDNNGVREKYSYGRRMSPPSYFRNEIVPIMDNGHQIRCATFTRYSSSVISLSNSAQGNIVGYDKVIEYQTNSSGGIVNGKTEYEYENKEDILFQYKFPIPPALAGTGAEGGFVGLPMRKPGIRNLGHVKNGLLLRKTDFEMNGAASNKVLESINYYSTKEGVTLYNLTAESLPSSSASLFLTFVYPAFRSEKVLLDSTVQLSYYPQKQMKVKTEYFYENPSHLQATRILTSKSDGTVEVQRNYFCLDQINGLTDEANTAKASLTSKHIIAPVLQSETLNNQSQRVLRTNYKVFGNGIPLPESIDTKLEDSPFDKRVVFAEYDDQGNLLSQTKTSDVPVSYVWGYDQTYPIAEVKNAKQNEIFFTSFETGDGNSAENDSHNGRLSRLDGYSKTITNLTPDKNYYLTYWLKEGNLWTFKKESVSLNSMSFSYTISLSGQIDDVRFYPQDAEMISYTYDPLIGVTSVMDGNDVTTYHEYDSFGRLSLIRDLDKNIVKRNTYEFKKK